MCKRVMQRMVTLKTKQYVKTSSTCISDNFQIHDKIHNKLEKESNDHFWMTKTWEMDTNTEWGQRLTQHQGRAGGWPWKHSLVSGHHLFRIGCNSGVFNTYFNHYIGNNRNIGITFNFTMTYSCKNAYWSMSSQMDIT